MLRTSTDDQAKLASLKFLAHWVGDIHQPHHVSFADDRRGNFIRANGPCGNMNLHAAWDVCIIEKGLGTDSRLVARELLESITEGDRAAWVGLAVETWADESLPVTRRESVQYCLRVGTKCVYRPGSETYSPGEEEKVVVVDMAYLELHVPLVRERLKRAGIRLAHLLNTTLGR